MALAETTEQFVAAFVEPKACKETGKVAIAGKELCCEQMAGETATVAKTAMDKVQMTYLIGEKECSARRKRRSWPRSLAIRRSL